MSLRSLFSRRRCRYGPCHSKRPGHRTSRARGRTTLPGRRLCELPRARPAAGQPGWIYSEPNPYNPPTNLRLGEAPTLSVDLSDDSLPPPRLKPVESEVGRGQRGKRSEREEIVYVPAFTDLKLHDICADASDPNIEPLDMQQPNGSMGFFAGNRKFITKKLWGCANEPPFFHHGQYATMRQAILAHSGQALASARRINR